MTVTAAAFWEAVEAQRGARFRHRGRAPGWLDCVGLVFVSAWQCGLATPDFQDYDRCPRSDVLLAALAERCDPCGFGELRELGRILVVQPAAVLRPIHFQIMGPDGLAAEVERRWRMVPVDSRAVQSVWRLRGVM